MFEARRGQSTTPAALRQCSSIGIAIVAAALIALGAATTDAAPDAKATVELVAARTELAPGATERVAAVLRIQDGWHANSNRPTLDYLIGTQAHFTLPPGWTLESVDYPAGHLVSFAFARDQPLSVYEGEVPIIASLRPPASAVGRASIEARVGYQACNDKVCLPPAETTAKLEVTLGTSGRPVGHRAFEGGNDSNASRWVARGMGLLLLAVLVAALLRSRSGRRA